MTGTLQPLARNFQIVDPASGMPTDYFIKWAQQRQVDITGSISAGQAVEIIQQYLTDHQLQAGTGISLAPDGNLVNSPTISANVQAILDTLTQTQGSVIFRGAAGWEALPPGTVGQLLQSGGSGADPSWASGGGGSIAVEQNGSPVVIGATSLNFTGSVTVTDAGGGQANINISGGGGGGVPTIVQKKIEATSNIAAGITLDTAPIEGNILVALCLNSTGTAIPAASAGWTSVSSSTTLPDHNILTKKVGPSEGSLQAPTSANDGGVVAIYEVTGTVAIAPGLSVVGTVVASVNLPFTSNNEYQPAATGLLIGFSGRRTDESGSLWSGTLTKDLEVAGAVAVVGGTGVSASTATGTLVINGAPASSCLWPSSAATLGQFVLVA